MRTMLIVLLASLSLVSCSGGSDDESDEGNEAGNAPVDQEDGGQDADTDADADADADTDSDGDGDADADAGEPWSPVPGTTWQWQLTEAIDTGIDADMYDIDLFEAPQTVIDTLHGAGRKVICYFSAGSREDWRPDADRFTAAEIGKQLVGWPGENWIDIRSGNVRAVMKDRLDMAADKTCDGVEPDNVDGFANDNGLGLTASDQLGYNRFLAGEAHARGLSVGLKNDLDQVGELEPSFDWALNEECLAYGECAALKPFLDANKAVFHVEYVDDASQGQTKAAEVCGDAAIQGFSTLIKTWDLTAWRIACN